MDAVIQKNKDRNIHVFKISYYVTLAADFFLLIAQPLNITILEMLSSRCFLICTVAVLIAAVSHSYQYYMPYKTHQIIILGFLLCFSFVSYLLSGSSGLYDYLVRMLCYIALPVYFIMIDYLKPDKIMIQVTFIVNILISGLFTYLSFSSYRYAGYESYIGTGGAWLTMGYHNPNQTAMYLLVNLIILLCALHYYKQKSIRFLLLIDSFYIGYLLFETSSRTCIIAGIFILLFTLPRRHYTISKFTATAVLFLPLIFILLYPTLFQNGWLHLLEFRGKSDFDSRNYIFRTAVATVSNQFLFGNYGMYQLRNLHNGILSVYSSLGLTGVLFFYLYYIKAYFHILSYGIKSKVAYISMGGLLAVFLHACTESAFLTGGSIYAGGLCILIYLTRLDSKEVN